MNISFSHEQICSLFASGFKIAYMRMAIIFLREVQYINKAVGSLFTRLEAQNIHSKPGARRSTFRPTLGP